MAIDSNGERTASFGVQDDWTELLLRPSSARRTSQTELKALAIAKTFYNAYHDRDSTTGFLLVSLV